MIIDIPSNLFVGATRIYLDVYAASKASLYIHREPPHQVGFQFQLAERPDQFIMAAENIQTGIGYASGDAFILERISDAENHVAWMRFTDRRPTFLALFKPQGLSMLLDGLKRIR